MRKDIMKRLFTLAMIATGFAFAQNVSAMPSDESRATAVYIGDLDLSRTDGMDTLYARLRAAAKSVCRDQIRRAPIELQTHPQCVATALASAIRSLDHQAFADYVTDRRTKSSRAG
jgi:UrcA family protein